MVTPDEVELLPLHGQRANVRIDGAKVGELRVGTARKTVALAAGRHKGLQVYNDGTAWRAEQRALGRARPRSGRVRPARW